MAKRDWLSMGDRNTQFYYAWASQRRRQNNIEQITDLAGTIWSNQEDVGRVFTSYFQQLFSTEGSKGLKECISAVDPKVTPGMNEYLVRVFLPQEVDTALAQMNPLKAPGPDGFGACFYQKHWLTLGDTVRQAALEFLNVGTVSPSFNSTLFALIPKVYPAVSVSDFRPISLCNVFYKLVAKVLANRLKQVLLEVISPHQSAFVPGRLITNNVLVAYEALHTMHSRIKGRKGYMALKLDMSKAYDRVEWGFLEAMMQKLGFADRWIAIIMLCVNSVSYQVLVNGTPYGCIVPTRGLRFLLCVEGLCALMRKAEIHGLVTGIPIAGRGFKLSHLFFTDDSLIFCRANYSEWGNVMTLLKQYEKASR